MLDPDNKLYRQDCAALLRALGDKLPDQLSDVERTAVPADQSVCFIVARGCPDGWQDRNLTYHIPGCVPTDWTFSYPAFHPIDDPGFSVRNENTVLATGAHLADLSEILNEEFWQRDFPGMIDRACKATEAMTVAHDAAKASLAAALAMQNSEYKPLIVANARAAVAATSRAFVREREWRRWVTLPRSYSVAHVQLPPPGASRKLVLALNTANGETKEFEVNIAPEINRAVVYLREINQDKYLLKKWESME